MVVNMVMIELIMDHESSRADKRSPRMNSDGVSKNLEKSTSV